METQLTLEVSCEEVTLFMLFIFLVNPSVLGCRFNLVLDTEHDVKKKVLRVTLDNIKYFISYRNPFHDYDMDQNDLVCYFYKLETFLQCVSREEDLVQIINLPFKYTHNILGLDTLSFTAFFMWEKPFPFLVAMWRFPLCGMLQTMQR